MSPWKELSEVGFEHSMCFSALQSPPGTKPLSVSQGSEIAKVINQGERSIN